MANGFILPSGRDAALGVTIRDVNPDGGRPRLERLGPGAASRAVDEDVVEGVELPAQPTREQLPDDLPAHGPQRALAEKPVVGEPAVQVDGVDGPRSEAVVGDEGDGGIRTGGAHQVTDRLVERRVHGCDRSCHVAVGDRFAVDVSPEAVLHAVRRIEDDGEQIGRPAPCQMEGRPGAAASELCERLEIREGLRAVHRVVEDDAARRLDVDPVPVELARHLGRSCERLVGGREKTADHESVDGPDRIRRRHVDDADPHTCTAGDLPERWSAEIAGAREAGRVVAVGTEPAEGEHAVPARISTRCERRPRRQRERRHRRSERPPASPRHQDREIRQPAVPRPGLEHAPRRTVEPDDQDLRHREASRGLAAGGHAGKLD